jgi:hypothetical protein
MMQGWSTTKCYCNLSLQNFVCAFESEKILFQLDPSGLHSKDKRTMVVIKKIKWLRILETDFKLTCNLYCHGNGTKLQFEKDDAY